MPEIYIIIARKKSIFRIFFEGGHRPPCTPSLSYVRLGKQYVDS